MKRAVRIALLPALLAAGVAAADSLPPPTGLAASTDSCWGIRLSWDAVPGATDYRIRRGDEVFQTVDLFFRDTAAPAGSTLYWVAGADIQGAGDSASVTGFRPAPPAAPAALAGSDSSCAIVRLDWTASAEADSYRVRRDGAPVATVDASVLFLEDVPPPGVYLYDVAARNRCGWSDSTAAPGERLGPPGPPGAVAASDTSCHFILVTWTDASDEEGYRIYKDGSETPAAELPADEISWKDEAVEPGVSHAYRVASMNRCGETDGGTASGERVFGYPGTPAAVEASDGRCDSVAVTWAPATEPADADSYVVYFREEDGGSAWTRVGSAAAPPYRVAHAPAPGVYTYYVSACNACGCTPATAGSQDTGSRDAPPEAAPLFTAESDSAACAGAPFRLVWTGVEGAESYVLIDDTTEAPVGADTFWTGSSDEPGGRFYRVRAENSCGAGPESDPWEVKILAVPPRPVAAAASDTLCGAVRLGWDGPADADGFLVWRDGTLVDSVGAAARAYIDSVAPGAYLYGVAAANACGRSDTVALSGNAAGPPVAPASASASDSSCAFIRVAWTASAEADSYRVFRDGAPAATVPAPVLAWEDSVPSGEYLYGVAAGNRCGWSDTAAAPGSTLPGPVPPETVEASDSSCLFVRLAWSAAPGAEAYRVWRDGTPVEELDKSVLVYRDTLAPGDHLYGVSAGNLCGWSDSTVAEGAVLAVPAPPAAFAASEALCAAVRLSWDAAAGADSYHVYREGAPVASLGADLLSYEDPAPPGAYRYAVAAGNRCGRSDTTGATGLSLGPPPPVDDVSASEDSCGFVQILWNAVAEADSYAVYREGESAAVTAETVFVDSLSGPGTFYYAVAARNACGESDARGDRGTRPPDPPSPPAGVAATTDSCGYIRITWPPAPDAESYELFRDGGLLGATVDTLYRDFAAAADSSYLYTVRALNTCGASGESDAVPGARPPDSPAPPDSTGASADRCDGILLAWSDTEQEEGFVVLRDGAPADTLPADALSWLDTAAAPGFHTYRVGAFNGCSSAPAFGDSTEGFLLPAPLPPADLAADSICGGVRLAWSGDEWTEGYIVARRLGEEGAILDTLGPEALEYDDLTADTGAVYEYALGVFNVCHPDPVFGDWAPGVRPWDTPLPPAGVSAGEGTCGSIRIDWLRSAHADGYRVFRNNVLAAVTDSPFLVDGEAAPGTHLYKVKAYNSCGVSGFSDADAGSRPPDPPAAPGGLTATNNDPRFIRLDWTDTADEEGYRIYRDGAGIPIIVLGPDSDAYEDNAATSGVHSYRVEAYNACGAGITDPVEGERTPGFPDAPEETDASDDRCDDVTVTWNYAPGALAAVDSFVVSTRDPEAGPNWTVIGAVAGPPYRLVHVPPPGAYEYRVVAVNEYGSSPETEGSKDEGRRLGPPDSPAGFVLAPAEVCGGRPFTLAWRPVEGALSYDVEEIGAGTVSVADTSLVLSRTEVGEAVFRVRAAGVCGAGDWSGEREVEVQALPAPPVDPAASGDLCGAIRLSWTASSNGGVWIETDTGAVFLDGAQTSWTDSLPEGGARDYAVGGWNACDTLAASAEVSGYAFPLSLEAPRNVAATDGLCDSVEVTWEWEGNPAALDSFRVIRADGPITSVVAVVAAGEPLRAADRNAAAGRRYDYRVRAHGRCARSAEEADSGGAETRPPAPAWDNPQAGACAGSPYLLRWTGSTEAEEYVLRESDTLLAVLDSTSLLLRPEESGNFRFTVAARNGCGESDPGEIWTLLAGEAPSPPDGVVLDSSYCDSIVIEWAATPDSVRIYRSDRIDPVWSGPGDGRFIDSPGRAVVYRLHGFNGCGESEGVEAALFHPRQRPRAPSSVTASDGFCDSVAVAWDLPASDIAVDRIEVRRVRNDTTIVLADSLPSGARSFVDRDGSGIYTYEVYAGNRCGISSPDETSRDEGGFLPAPPPGRFDPFSDAAACAGDSFTLSWEPGEGALDYRLTERVGGLDQPVATLGADRTSWRGFAAAAGERVFRIRARGVCGFGARSDPWTVMVADAPLPPERFAATEGLCGRVRLSWGSGGAGVERFEIHRDGEPVGAVEAAETLFVDSTVIDGVAYSYEAAAVNGCGRSAWSGPATGASLPGLPPPEPETPADGAEEEPVPATLRWSAVEGAAGYAVRVEPEAGGAAEADTILGPEERTLLLFGAEPGAAYRWRVATRSACGVGVPSAWRVFTVAGAAPAALATTPVDGETEAPPDLTIRVRFNFPVDPAEIETVRLFRGTAETAGSARLEEEGAALLFEPAAPLAYGAEYLFRFDGLHDIHGRTIDGRTTIAFRVQPALRPFGDLNGDYARDLADLLLADSILVGLRNVAPYPIDRVDLNGDFRFNVADLVMLGRALADHGPSAPPAEGVLLPARAVAAAEPGDLPGRFRIVLSAPSGGGADAACWELVAEGGSGRFLSAGGAESGACRAWTSAAGASLRALLLGGESAVAGAGEARIELEWEGPEPPERIRVARLLLAGGPAGIRDLAAGAPVIRRTDRLHVAPNRPNPFNPVTEIHYYLPEPARVRITVHDLAGRVTARIADRPEGAGWRSASWDGRRTGGEPAASGTYFCRVDADGATRVIRMTLLR